MGNCSNKPAEQVDATANTKAAADTAAKPEQAAAGGSAPPNPMIFALMRNGHEVLRGAMADVSEHLDNGDAEAAAATYLKFERWMGLHKRMEEGNGSPETPRGFFAILDENFDGVAKENGLYADHEALDKLEHEMSEACKQEEKDLGRLKELWANFKAENESHLKKEEGVMMPRVMQLKKNGTNLKQVMKTEILPLVGDVDSEDFEFFVRFANETLNKHTGGMPRVRVFDHALWACVEESTWKKCDEWIKESVSDEHYSQLQAAINGVAA
mmetsp:Transcript_22344/g.62330  ORF Transcript_22344/g.62330 Transcript_22344/m.62330 type:complete len:270 (-) Transcript_22344:340-1149(-)|eukprot:CAMPEP_0198113822 /NCGR_PEP_ID=MMETSP1442-20131203/5390_1 /TAXON_ID= /ORGANISM="Craspedostauros australis, Strain CCMP3328" /LENGTH=269 /DNA_ID=CAMNT_0043771007 /DNA_START=215 /DNA_END=1024 /DNA_ORIENTATION=+